MKVLKSFLQSLSDEGVGFFVVIEGRAINLDADQVALYLEDPEAFESDHEAMERERMDRF